MAQPIVVNIFVGAISDVAPVPLKEWAKKEGRSPNTLRERAENGMLPGAYKQGREWYVNPVANALAGVQSVQDGEKGPGKKESGKKGQRGGDVRGDAGRKGPPGDEGDTGPGAGGWADIGY